MLVGGDLGLKRSDAGRTRHSLLLSLVKRSHRLRKGLARLRGYLLRGLARTLRLIDLI